MTIRSIYNKALWIALSCAMTTFTQAKDAIDDAVSFSGLVAPASTSTALTAVRGMQQLAAADLNALIQPGGGWVLRVTGVHTFLSTPNFDTDLARVALGACSHGGYRGFGASDLLVGWSDSRQSVYDPGLVVHLLEKEELCIASLNQSTDDAVVMVHGFLQEAP